MDRKRILVVEDDPAILKMTRARLEHEGFDVLEAICTASGRRRGKLGRFALQLGQLLKRAVTKLGGQGSQSARTGVGLVELG